MNMPAAEYRAYLAELLVAIERCVYFLDGSCAKMDWPLSGKDLARHNKEIELFMALSAINERFAKLQDTLGAAMRHAAVLAGEPSETFIRVLTHFEKVGVIPAVGDWQEMRALRNVAAHEYGTDYEAIAEHFNALHGLVPRLYSIALSFSDYCLKTLSIEASNNDFSSDFRSIAERHIS